MDNNLLPFSEFAEIVYKMKPPTDYLIKSDDRFSLVGEGPSIGIQFAGFNAGPLSMYQVKAATGAANLNITSTESLLQTARSGNEQHASRALDLLKVQVSGLNMAIASSKFSDKKFTARVIENQMGKPFVGGIVSSNYAPLTHAQYIEKCAELPQFSNALVHRWNLTDSRMDFTMMLSDSDWSVDGGIKSGVKGGNGQFGDKSAGLVAMLFRLLCTNGMMDVVDSAGFKHRHSKEVNLAEELKRVLSAASTMFDAAKNSMEIEIDVIMTLASLYRRGVLSRGAFKKTLARCCEEFSGTRVTGATSTLWGLSQAITAAARDYSFTQMQMMGQLAGTLVRGGIAQIEAKHPILDDRQDWAELLDEHGRVIDNRVRVLVNTSVSEN